ncbi:erythromycin esterase family protein [Streptomyces sp. PsTaAH-124]|uniref:erythromycin esterase family protein n=1 Tax=Streptomyces sp. PsTaAH-124 TaxID=1157638 RepID=UPI00036BD8D0|nr:erythromycin esterase family protein [Streptomyces sp. PsTaAH-124]
MTTGRRRPGRTAEDTGPDPAGAPPPLDGRCAALLGELAADARVLGWSEGVHLRTEYLTARNAVVRHLVERHAVRAIAAETNFALSRPTDAYIRGLGPDEPTPAAVTGMWSWSRTPLPDNRALLRWLRRHNTTLDPARHVRFYGLEMYGTAPEEPGEAPRHTVLDDPADRPHAAHLHRLLLEHRAAGGDHRDLAVRDAAQYLTLQEVARRHPDGRILLFEQVEHLDRRVTGSLGAHLARRELGRFRAVGAVWRDGDPTVRYPLGRYRELSRRLHDLTRAGSSGVVGVPAPAPLTGSAGSVVFDLRPWQPATADKSPAAHPDAPLVDTATAFDAVLYTPTLSPAGHIR